MKKSIATLLVAILALGIVNAFADAENLSVDDGAVIIKKAATAAIKAGAESVEMEAIITLLGQLGTDVKQQAVVLNAIKAALNTATLKSLVPAIADKLTNSGLVSVTKAAGGKWNIQLVSTDTAIKADIPRGAVEKPTLSSNANDR